MKRRRSGKDRMRLRFFTLVLGFFFVFAIIIFQAYRIQILHGSKLREQAEGWYKRQVTLVPTRGSIFDRNGEDLAITLPVDSIYAYLDRLNDPQALAAKLAPILDVNRSTLLRKLRENRGFTWIKRQVVPTISARIRELDESAIGVIQESRRFYPNLELASHLLGFVGVDGEGLEGIEFACDHLLRGEERRVMVDVDALGRMLPSPEGLTVARRDGHHLILTLDKEIQHVAEQHLERAVRATGSRRGMAVVLAPRTGEVMAMANVPRFNPNKYSLYSQDVLRNRCVTHPFEPGSTIKPLLIAAAVEDKVFKPTDVLFCEEGSYRIFNKTIHDVGRHGWLSIKKIIQYSSNIGAAKVGLSLGAERLYRRFQKFGFGKKTGIDLPGEAAGILRDYGSWSQLDLATISFGQGFSTTALQVAVAFSALANKGQLVKPFVVKEILDAQGNTVRRCLPEGLGQVVSPATARQVTRMLMDVVSEDGTGWQAAVQGYRVAGKTGTAQKADLRLGGYQQGRYVASFVGYIPAEEPRLCVAVVLEEPQGAVLGGQIAAPIFREVARDALGILGVYPDERLLAMDKNE